MPDTRNYLVKNIQRKRARTAKERADRTPVDEATGPVYQYLTDDGVPVAFTYEEAISMANVLGGGEDDIVIVPDGLHVKLSHRARKLPRSSDVSSVHYGSTERLI